MFIRFDRIYERDGQTDGWTDGQRDTARRPRLCIAIEQQKNVSFTRRYTSDG